MLKRRLNATLETNAVICGYVGVFFLLIEKELILICIKRRLIENGFLLPPIKV